MTFERLKDILISYVSNDLECTTFGYVRDVLSGICTNEELKELGFWDWLLFEVE